MSPIRHDPASVLRRTALFADLSEQELDALAHRTITLNMPSGHLIFSEDEQCEGLFVVAEGAVKIFKTAATGREQVLVINREGEVFAELPVFDGGTYPASAITTVDSTLLFVSRDDFRTLCLEHPEIALKVLKSVGGRLRQLVMLIEELSFTTVRSRLAQHLLRLARANDTKGERGTEFALGSHTELAAQIGTVRELVSRNLARLQSEGLIRMQGRRVLVADIDALENALKE
jgi:CRP-like cAMP-binding protein